MCALSNPVVCLQYVPGAKGGFFQTYVFFLFPPAHLVCHSPLCKYVPNLPYVYQNSNTPCFLGISTCACVLVVTSSPHHHRPSVIITGTSHFLSTITTSHHMTSYLRSITPHTTIEIICPSWLKRHPPLCLRRSLM